jgi:hypothetical protein
MSDNSQNNLQTALDNLPQYDAPNSVWDVLATRLPLIELPNYEAPESVWNTISERLPLTELPNYEAPESVWNTISERLPLTELPNYEAPESVWNTISERLPLTELPNYEAPESVWNTISERLPLTKLPNYEAPESVWDNLEKALATDKEHENLESESLPQLRVVSSRFRRFDRRFWAAAASIALFISVGLWYFNTKNGAEKGLQITTEVVDNQLLKQEVDKSMDSDDASFLMVEAFCKTTAVACEKPAFKKLKQELDDLNVAREELKMALTEYNTNADMVAELTKIENERTEVLQQLVEITTSLND